MEGWQDKWFKQYAIIAFLTVEKIPPIDIHHQAQAMYGNKCWYKHSLTLGMAVEARSRRGSKSVSEEKDFFKDGI